MNKNVKSFPTSRDNPTRETASLKDVVFKQVCKDIRRHSIQHHTAEDRTAYFILQRDYADKILETVLKTFPTVRHHEQNSTLHNMCRGWSRRNIGNFYKFLFNKFISRIELSGKDFNEYSTLAISQNCKGLLELTVHGGNLDPEICVPLFSNLRLLKVLSLRKCAPLTLETMQGISASLIHLNSLDLSETYIDNDAMYVLCGHTLPLEDSFKLDCCYTKCEINTSLKLESINISSIYDTGVTEEAIACLLTHIPTLKQISLTDDDNSVLASRYVVAQNATPFMRVTRYFTPDKKIFTLESVICRINGWRAKLGLPQLTFQLEDVNTNLCEFENGETFLGYFPNLKKLAAPIPPELWGDNRHLDDALVNHEFKHLEVIALSFSSTKDIFTMKFRRFWETKGRQITKLTLTGIHLRNIFSYSEFRGVVEMCPNLHTLKVYNGKLTGTEITEDFPRLPRLKELVLSFTGRAAEVKTVCYKIIKSCKNIDAIRLKINYGTKQFFEDMLTTEYFPFLRTVTLQTDDVHDTVNVQIE